MFDVVPYRILVRRIRSGDCDKIRELHAVVEPDLTAFCQSLTADAASARRAADSAFIYAAELLAAQAVTVGGFRSTLLGEAKGRCYSEIGRAAQLDSTEEPAIDGPAGIDFDQLQARLEDLRPESLSSPAARLTWRSRLAPSTAITVVLMMVVMIEMAAIGLDLIPQKPGAEESRNSVVDEPSLLGSSQASPAQNPRPELRRSDAADRRDDAEPKKSQPVDLPSESKPDTEQPTSRPEASEQDGTSTRDDRLPQVPPIVELPELQTPAVQVDVDVDPVNVQVRPPSDSGILPETSVCVGSTCVSNP